MKPPILFALALVWSIGALAQEVATSAETTDKATAVPATIDFQGRLHDSGGSPVNATLSITFSLYNVLSGGTALWTETRSVQVTDGLFQVKLGEVTPFTPAHFSGSDRWLGIKVGAEAEMSPRTKLSSVGYALQAIETDPSWNGNANATEIISRSGSVGIGLVNAPARLSVGGLASNPAIPGSTSAGLLSLRIQDAEAIDIGKMEVSPYAGWIQAGFNLVEADPLSLNPLGGNVGIGTTSPSQLLDVSGTFRLRGHLFDYNNTSGTSGQILTRGASGLLWANPVGDNWGSQSVVSNATLAGNGTSASPLQMAQQGATSGQVLKWNGTTWAPAADATGGTSSGWTDDGTIVRLTTTTDSVQINTTSRLGKLNVGGNVGLNLTSSIYFGSDATRITGLTGGDLRLVAEDLSMLTTEDITFGHYGDETWITFENATKRVGIGTLTPTDRLHVIQNVATAGLAAIKGVATPTTVLNYGLYGESLSATGYGLFGKSPKYGVSGLATGTQGRAVTGEATGTASIGVYGLATNTSSTGVWGEGSNQGIYGFSSSATGKGVYGKVSAPTAYSGYFEGGQFYVKGSAQVRDTLYAGVVDASTITTMPGIAHNRADVFYSFSTSWHSMASVTLNLPAPGYVLIIASIKLISTHQYGDATDVRIGVSKTNDGNGIKELIDWYLSSNAGSGMENEHVSGQAPLQVTSAGTQTFYLMGYQLAGDDYDNAMYANINLTALYFPVAYGTVD